MLAEAAELPLLPWVRDAIAVHTQYDPDTGEPLRALTLTTVPRQAGKSVMCQVLLLERALATPDGYFIYMAQNRLAATNRLKDMAAMLARSKLDPQHRATFGTGNEKLSLSNGAVIQVLPPTENAAHGESIDGGILDELFAIPPIVMEGVTPAMSARPHAQLHMISTAGTLVDSELLNDERTAAREDPQGDVSFVEYSKPDDVHPLDEDAWWTYHPGLGYTTNVKHLRREARRMLLHKFARAYCNITTAQSEEAIPSEWWARAVAAVPPAGELALAVDSSPLGVSIGAAFISGTGWHIEAIDYRPGSEDAWVGPRLDELRSRFTIQVLAYDSSGPASAMAPLFKAFTEQNRIALKPVSSVERARADHHLYQGLKDGNLTHGTLDALEEAVGGVGTQTHADLWRFSRKRSVADPSPLLACSLALWAGYEHDQLVATPALHDV